MSSLLWAILLGAVTYRLGRLVILDTITAKLRDKVTRWLTKHAGPKEGRDKPRIGWAGYLLELIQCPYCVTVWISGGVTLAALFALDRGLPAPLAVWGGAAAFSLVVWNYVDNEGLEVILKKAPPTPYVAETDIYDPDD